MRIIDVDAHFNEPMDWVKQVDPGLAAELPPPVSFIDMVRIVPPIVGSLPPELRPEDPFDAVPLGFRDHLERTSVMQREHTDPTAGEPFDNADARIAFCDERGIDVQFLNPTFNGSAILGALMSGRPELLPRVLAAYNTWATEHVAGHSDRLIPVTQINLTDVDWSVKELARMRKAGSRAFTVGMAPVEGKSVTHPDFDRIWSAAEDLGMAAFAHVGPTAESINPGWAANGGDISTFSLLQLMATNQLYPQLLIGAMILDGILERHPKLIVIGEELGVTWLSDLISSLDELTQNPSLAGQSYRHPLKPSEYIRRQVRASPLAKQDALLPSNEQFPMELLCFCTDYPHLEGSVDAVELFSNQLTDTSDVVRERFFGGIGELLEL